MWSLQKLADFLWGARDARPLKKRFSEQFKLITGSKSEDKVQMRYRAARLAALKEHASYFDSMLRRAALFADDPYDFFMPGIGDCLPTHIFVPKANRKRWDKMLEEEAKRMLEEKEEEV